MNLVSIATERYRRLFGPLPDPVEFPGPDQPLPADHPDDDGPAPIRAYVGQSHRNDTPDTNHFATSGLRYTETPFTAGAKPLATYERLTAGERLHLDELAELTAEHGPWAAAQKVWGDR